MTIRQTACIYFTLQSIAVGAWWLLLLFVPSSRIVFKMGDSETILLAFWLPDLLLIAIGSLVVAAFCFFESRLTSLAAWFVCGGVSYATLYCFAFAIMTDSGWLGTMLMLPAMLWSGCFAMALSDFKNIMFRQAKQSSSSWILAKTTTQIIVVWSLILLIFPSFIIRLEDKLGIVRFSFPFQKILSVIFFILISLIGLSSAYTMSKIGKGTPLPLDSASRLVIKGTYAFVRNPMAISGIGQGLAVGMFLGSPLVLIYAIMGGLIWQFIFRPLEEIDLRARFGNEYEDYCQNVRCWFPRLKPYFGQQNNYPQN